MDGGSEVCRERTAVKKTPPVRSIALALFALGTAALPAEDSRWWAYAPLQHPGLPTVDDGADADWVRTPIDAFIVSRLREEGLRPSQEADRRTLIRRLSFDLIGLPPTPQEVEAFVADKDPRAYEGLVERLLESPHYGERWARHWLDVVHYGDTHGYDKDKLRPNAYHYRDYVIRAFNDDRRYTRFVEEQIAGDILYPGARDAIIATGFISAGPWDFIGHVEVPETKIDGRRARNLDRDDMVTTTMNTFVSTTVQCARCHEHKFDPISQEQYYSLQAVFAQIDRGDRKVDADPTVAKRRGGIARRRAELEARKEAIEKRIRDRGGKRLVELDAEVKRLGVEIAKNKSARFGYHSRIEKAPDTTKWVQVDLGESKEIDRLRWVACHDDFNGIGAGFGYPVRFRIEASDDPAFKRDVDILVDRTTDDVENPGVEPQSVKADGVRARYIRVTATKLAARQNDYIFALAELTAFGSTGVNLSRGVEVTALDSIEAPARWQRVNLVDGYYVGAKEDPSSGARIAELRREREEIIAEAIDDATRREREQIAAELTSSKRDLDGLPAQISAYVGWPIRKEPREIRVLRRGDITAPQELVRAGALPLVPGRSEKFELAEHHTEGDRRVALARWITDSRNPLTWRSIVNRVWHHHFGRGIVETPNDFGRMGQLPTHPELLDWLAIEFRDGGQSLKKLHRLIVTSAVYRQSVKSVSAYEEVDRSNRLLWRMNRRRLDAEALRDSVLVLSGKLDRTMFGPAFRDFVIEKPEHSPHYEYHKHDPDDRSSHRRAVYRFLVRSAQQPFMETLDCADPSQRVDRRDETLTVLQALALLNNRFMTRMAYHFSKRLEAEHETGTGRVVAAFRMATGRSPDSEEVALMEGYAREHGLANLCRGIFNLNEFIFVD